MNEIDYRLLTARQMFARAISEAKPCDTALVSGGMLERTSGAIVGVQRERDNARSWNQYLGGACVLLFVALLFVASHPTRLTKTAPVCPQSGVMHLDPSSVRARQSEVIEL